MGIKRYFKKKIIISSMEKRKKANPFDVEYSDKFELPADAGADQNNSHYFSLHSFDSKECFYLRCAKRGQGSRDEVWLVFRTASGDVYLAEQDHFQKDEAYPAVVTCVVPGKHLKFSYKGKVKKAILKDGFCVLDEKSESIDCVAEGDFYGTGMAFEMSRHLSSIPMGNTLSQEKWTKKFLAEIKENHQVHYEQAGKGSVKVTIGKEKFALNDFSAFRDHSYGKRDWNYFDRYLWLVGLLENGDFIHSSMIRYPAISEITAGFYESKDGVKCILSGTSMDDIPHVNGSVPKEFSFDTVYIDNDKKHIDCKLDFVVPFKFGDDTYHVNEGVSEFTVNGIRGRGITEFAFNKDSSRWGRPKK